MGVYEREGVCYPLCGDEEDCLRFVNDDDECTHVGMCVALPIESEEWPVDWIYEAFTENWTLQFWQDIRQAYRKETGRQYPPLYRVRIRIEAESLTDDEARKYWEGEDE